MDYILLFLIIIISGCNGASESNETTVPIQTVEFLCGIRRAGVSRIQTQVFGGKKASPHSWPWQVAVVTEEELCGGSIIDSRHVITAAHCTDKRTPMDITVFAGVHDLTAALQNDTATTRRQFEQKRNVERIIQHPQYGRPLSESNDIAILVLDRPLEFNRGISPVCLPDEDSAEDVGCFATGWGRTEGTGDNRYLLQVMIPIISSDICNDTDKYNGGLDEGMLCAGVPGRDTCQGDSGGPLVCPKGQGREAVYYLHGVTSFGDECGGGKPGVYSKVTMYKNWILENLTSQ